MKENYVLSDAAREARRKYQQEYRRLHPEKEKAYRVKYWENVAKKMQTELVDKIEVKQKHEV